jgi:hypothetical protein
VKVGKVWFECTKRKYYVPKWSLERILEPTEYIKIDACMKSLISTVSLRINLCSRYSGIMRFTVVEALMTDSDFPYIHGPPPF